MYDGLWLKRVLIPLWVIILLFVIIECATTALVLGVSDNAKDRINDGDYYNDNSGLSDSDYRQAFSVIIGVAAAYFVVSALVAIFQIVEIVQYARKKLSPVLMVVLNTITFVFFAAIFIISIVGVASSGSAFAVIWPIVLVAASLAKLIYSSVILHRFRKNRTATRGAYTPAQAEQGLDSTAYSTHDTAYNPAAPYNNPAGGPPSNPFRDGRDPSPAMRPAGAADSYYAPGGQYEMTQQQPGGGRYYG